MKFLDAHDLLLSLSIAWYAYNKSRDSIFGKRGGESSVSTYTIF